MAVVVATCRPLIGPDGLAASSLPFLMRKRPPPVDCYGLVPTAAALNISRSCASHTLSLWMLAHPAARRGATPIAVPHRGSGGNRVRPTNRQLRQLKATDAPGQRSLTTLASNASRQASKAVLHLLRASPEQGRLMS
jgi:hypothetical protein